MMSYFDVDNHLYGCNYTLRFFLYNFDCRDKFVLIKLCPSKVKSVGNGVLAFHFKL